MTKIPSSSYHGYLSSGFTGDPGFSKSAIFLALILMLVTFYPLLHLGYEFMPPLDEGDLLYMPTTMPGLSITKARELLQQTDRLIKTVPEVDYVFGKAGRAETATDPAPLSMLETTIKLKDRAYCVPAWTPKNSSGNWIRPSDFPVWPIPGVTPSRSASTCFPPV